MLSATVQGIIILSASSTWRHLVTLDSSVLPLFREAVSLETRCNKINSHSICWYMSVCNINIASRTYLYKDLKNNSKVPRYG